MRSNFSGRKKATKKEKLVEELVICQKFYIAIGEKNMRTLFDGKHTLLKDPTKEKCEVLRRLLDVYYYDLPFGSYTILQAETVQINIPYYYNPSIYNHPQYKTFEEWVIEITGVVKKQPTVLDTFNHRLEFDDNGARVIPTTSYKGDFRFYPETLDKIVETWEKHKNGL